MLRYSLIATSLVGVLGAITGRGDNALPAHPSFDRYSAMADRSPFAIATAVAMPAATPDFAKDLYVANAARLPGGDLITIASSSDQNFKKYLTTGQAVDGFSISGIEWSDRVGATKVTISKGGNFATLTFNQALLSQRAAAPKAPPLPDLVPQAVPLVQTPEAPKTPRVQKPGKPGAPALPTPNPTPESPPRPDPPKSEQQRQEEKIRRQEEKTGRQRQLKADSARPVAPTQPPEEAYIINAQP